MWFHSKKFVRKEINEPGLNLSRGFSELVQFPLYAMWRKKTDSTTSYYSPLRGSKETRLKGEESKKAWPVVGEDVLDAILSFFYSGSLLREVNKTIIALVPKIPNATKLSDYRPISCCNTIYKCLTKLIANRVKVVLGELIDPSQTAFVPCRSLMDNILLSQEILRNSHRESPRPTVCHQSGLEESL